MRPHTALPLLALLAAASVRADVREEAHQRILAELGKPAKSAPAILAAEKPKDELPPICVTPHEDPVDKFFRTGILVSDHSPEPAKKISVGPCEGGQLLNLRSSW